MKTIITDIDALRAVNARSIHAYLNSQGWTRRDDLGERGVVYVGLGNREVFAPGSDRLGDYAESVSALISEVAEAEQRDDIAVYRDLATADRDLLRFRAPQADGDGAIDLNSGVDLVQQSRDALLAAACSAASPRRYYRSGSNARANDYLKTVKLGQTEHGSFVVTLFSPVPPQLEAGAQRTLWPEIAEEPFGRQVTRTLAKAVDALVLAIAEVGRGADIEAFEKAVIQGVSANLCAAVAKFVSDGQGLDFSLTWARTRPSPEPRHRAVFNASDSELLAEAAKVLKSRESFRNEVLEGYVTVLNREMKATNGRVRLKTFVEGQTRSVAVELPPELYKRALEAHESKTAISLEGDLDFEGQRWSLKNPRNLEIIEEKETDE